MFSCLFFQLRNLATRADVSFLDLYPYLVNHDPESLWISNEDFHANSKVHNIMAEAIYQKIQKIELDR